MDALLGWYPYSGDREAIGIVRLMLDYHLAHGTTPADWEWPQMPFSTSCLADKDYGQCLRGYPKDFTVASKRTKWVSSGLSYVQFYELTGERKYLEAGIKCATASLPNTYVPGMRSHAMAIPASMPIRAWF